MDVIPGKFLPSVQTLEFNQKIKACDLSPQLANQLHRGRRRPAGCQQIIDDEDPLADRNRVPMDSQGTGSVFQVVFHFETISRELAWFPNRHKSGSEPGRQSPAENEPSRLDPDNLCNPLTSILDGEIVRDLLKRRRVLQQRGDVVEEDSGLGEIRYFPDEGFIIHRESTVLQKVGPLHRLFFDGPPKPD